jgi:aminoacylase
VRITVKGSTGHAVHFIENTAVEKVRRIVNDFLSFRDAEKAKIGSGPEAGANLGNVTTVNVTMIQANIIHIISIYSYLDMAKTYEIIIYE